MMPCNIFSGRRLLLAGLCALPAVSLFSPFSSALAAPDDGVATLRGALLKLEAASGGRLGVAAVNTADNRQFSYRGEERFPFCSTFKVLAVAALLRQAAAKPALLRQRLFFRQDDLVPNSPITERHTTDGMTVAELCAAALQYSDNTAANLLLDMLGGPAGLTAFARSIKDGVFRLDRREPELNGCEPGDIRDTSTPLAMARTLRRIACGPILEQAQRRQLLHWMRGAVTGANRIRAGVPTGWGVADKTGSGPHGTANDLAVLEPPRQAPLILALYLTQAVIDGDGREAILAETARAVCAHWFFDERHALK